MKNVIKTYLLIGLLSGLLIFIGGAIAGEGGVAIALVFSLVFNVIALWFSDRIVLSMYKAEQIQRSHPSGLYEVVERLARKANIPMPKVYIIPDNAPNAFATGRSPQKAAVAATSGLLLSLSPDEIEAVIAHEITHIKNRDTLVQTLVAVIASAIIHITAIAKWGMIFGFGRGEGGDDKGGLFTTILLIIFAPIAALLVQAAISRSREYMADKGSKDIIGSGMPLANALRKIENVSARGLVMESASQETAHMFIMNPLSGKSLFVMFSTHPKTEDRIKALLYND
jgi:heat shock protein HtpX